MVFLLLPTSKTAPKKMDFSKDFYPHSPRGHYSGSFITSTSVHRLPGHRGQPTRRVLRAEVAAQPAHSISQAAAGLAEGRAGRCWLA